MSYGEALLQRLDSSLEFCEPRRVRIMAVVKEVSNRHAVRQREQLALSGAADGRVLRLDITRSRGLAQGAELEYGQQARLKTEGRLDAGPPYPHIALMRALTGRGR